MPSLPSTVRSRRPLAAALTTLVLAMSAPAAGATPVPPPAPSPTSTAKSPDTPDPHPPVGGLGPDGEHIGGPRLQSRGLIEPAGAPALPAGLTARAFVVADLDTGAVIAARDPHGRYQPASIQKLLTTVTLLPILPGSRVVTAAATAANAEGSRAGLVPGGHYTVDQLFEGLLMESGNDTAEALAEAAGGRAHTVALMNRTAVGLGAYDTVIQTPSGLDGWQQLTSAYDMTLFLRAALKDPRFARYDTVRHTFLPAQKPQHQKPVPLWNQNYEFLDTVPGALVAKTGYTDAAQHTFAGAIERHGHRYGVVLLRAQRYPQDQWVQATRLIAWADRTRALPPVGHLDGAVALPARRAVAAASPSPSASSSRSRSSGGTSHLGIKIVILLVFLGAGVYLTRRLRSDAERARRRRREQDERPDGPPTA